jgi:hypothetical protein
LQKIKFKILFSHGHAIAMALGLAWDALHMHVWDGIACILLISADRPNLYYQCITVGIYTLPFTLQTPGDLWFDEC